MFTFLLILQTIVAVAMIAMILMQRSEGGGLVSGGSPSGMMSARGAADFLTRSTSILAVIFVGLSIVLAGLAASRGGPRTIDADLMNRAPAGAPVEQQNTPFDVIPGAQQPAVPGAAPSEAPAQQAPTEPQSGVPIAQ